VRRLLVAAAAVTAGVAATAAVLVLTPAAAPAVVDVGEVPLATPVVSVDGAAVDRPEVAPATAAEAVSLPASVVEPVSTSVDTSSAVDAEDGNSPASQTLTAPALGIDAPVVPVSTGRDGVLHPPANIREVGRWIGGAEVGDLDGTVVLTGHLDSRSKGRGALYSLGTARPGQQVSVGDVAYEIAAIRSYDKRALPTDVWATDGQHRLVIITCGGAFTGGHYEKNTVVYALPR
jgi:hypothetical protein